MCFRERKCAAIEVSDNKLEQVAQKTKNFPLLNCELVFEFTLWKMKESLSKNCVSGKLSDRPVVRWKSTLIVCLIHMLAELPRGD